MQADELERWREANRLFSAWLSQDDSDRDVWLAAQDIADDISTLLRQLIARQQSDDGGTLALEAMLDTTSPRVPATNALAGRQVGQWTLLDELGRGGMSVVYRARRAADGYEQIAAVKLLGMAALGSEGSARFEHERAVLARLRHPHIATLIDGGIADDGTPFLVMALIEGRNLSDHCQAQGLGWRERVALVRSVCDAAAYAHRNLLVHRDIKPTNILVTVEGVPVLLDFGIAKLLDDESEHTRTGMRAMTPGYAAPEQVNADTITTATDVYALGVVLRNLCKHIQPLPADLLNIIGKATRVEPERRYPDARALGDDLDNLLQHKPVQATPDSWLYRLRVLLRRRRGAVIASTLVVMSLLVGLVLTLWQYQRAAHEAAEARHQAARAQASRDFLFSIVGAGNRNSSEDADVPVSQIISRGVASLEDNPPDDPELHAEMAMMLGELETIVGHYDSAARLFDASQQQLARLDDNALAPGLSVRRGVLANAKGDPAAAIAHFQAALDAAPALSTERQAALLPAALDGWTYAMNNSGQGEEARQHLQAVVANAAYAPPGSTAHAALLMALLSVTRNPQERLELLTRIRATYENVRPTLTEQIAIATGLSSTYQGLRQPVQALPWAREAARLTDRVHPGITIRRARAQNNLGHASATAFALGEAVDAYTTALDLYRDLGDDHSPAFAAALHNRATLLRDVGQAHQALPMLEQALALAREHFGDSDARSLTAQRNLALAYALVGDGTRAEAIWQEAMSRLPQHTTVVDLHEMWLAGTLIAATNKQTDVLDERLAEVQRLARSDSSAVLSAPRTRAWHRGLAAIALSLHGDDGGASDLFEETFAEADLDGNSDWAPRRYMHLAWANHLERHGRGEAAQRQREAVATLLRAGGLEAAADKGLRRDSGLEVDADSGAAALPE